MIEYPLTKANRIRLARAFYPVPRVDFSIDCVLEGQMGAAFVDDSAHPAVFQIQVGPFVYFAGDAACASALAALHTLVFMIEYPLTKANRIRLARAFYPVPRVDFSIDCVLEGQMGAAFVDDSTHPAVFQIQVGPFVYFAGDAACANALTALHTLTPPSAGTSRTASSTASTPASRSSRSTRSGPSRPASAPSRAPTS